MRVSSLICRLLVDVDDLADGTGRPLSRGLGKRKVLKTKYYYNIKDFTTDGTRRWLWLNRRMGKMWITQLHERKPLATYSEMVRGVKLLLYN